MKKTKEERTTETIRIITEYYISYDTTKPLSRNEAISATVKELPFDMSTFSKEHGYYTIKRGKSKVDLIAAEIDRLQRVKK